ncbi:AAA family ATPase [Deefgea tanakiae]|uniref:AAA family ATPase n=1 Tax=Deefgea tanakiae TaxID=2865840 RepID=A0ABX8Z3N6_9NEIS|nr:AAA family ATPase [Deefgea tanakiae]QZA77171.1 AAA family ATPase [Deefgea tanakiae]
MYLEFFGLKSPPFRLTAHPDFFFSGAGRGALLDALLYAVTSGEGLIKVTGEVGAGKTMLCRMLLERLPSYVVAIFLPNPVLSEDELLLTLADELKIQFHSDRASQKIRLIEETLIAKYAAGRQVVLIVDEAHAMPQGTLELIRLLSNLDSGHQKLLQIVLFGQLELDEILQQDQLRALRERVSYSLAVPVLNSAEVADYLACRLFAAGHHGNAIFTPVAVKHIAEVAQGLSRRVNLLADKAMLAAFSEHSTLVTLKHAKLAERECEYAAPISIERYWLALLLVLTFAISVGAWHFLSSNSAASSEKVANSVRVTALTSTSASHVHSSSSENAMGELILQSRARIKAAEASSITVLVSKIPSQKSEQLKSLITEINQLIGPGRVIIYPTKINGVSAWGVLAGLYPDRQRAQTVKNRLQQKLRGTQVQTIGVLRSEMLLPRD